MKIQQNFRPLIKTLLFLLLITAYSSCSDDPVTNNNGPTYYTISAFTGKIHNLPDSSRTLVAVLVKDSVEYSMGSATIGADSTMNINLTIPTDGQLHPIVQLFSPLGTGTVNVSDLNAKGNYVNLLAYATGTQTWRGVVTKANTPTIYTPQLGNVYISYFYSDRNVSATANTIRYQGADTTKFNVSFAFTTGYNKLTTRITALRANYMEVEVLSGEPSGTEWYFIQNSGDQYNRKSINNLY